ncbi:hypothetical protein ACQ4PT_014351 [Festuca glaucescens]
MACTSTNLEHDYTATLQIAPAAVRGNPSCTATLPLARSEVFGMGAASTTPVATSGMHACMARATKACTSLVTEGCQPWTLQLDEYVIAQTQGNTCPLATDSTNQDDIQSTDSPLFDLSTLRAATDNFSGSNKLGEGGFGSVYKGILCEGQEIAVKRLSQTSTQGVEELKTELVLVAKLQHKNLVRLVGVCLQGQEKLLVWQHWSTGTVEDLADPSRSPGAQMLKLVNIGLLCVQDNPADRPTMSAVNVMLSSTTVSLQAPSSPTFCVDDMEGFSYMYSEAYPARGSQMSPNQVSLTELEPR